MAITSFACADVSEESFDTELAFDSPPNLGIGGTIEIRKRFRFSADPAEAASVTLRMAELSIRGDAPADFAFMQYLDVFVVDDSVQPEERVLIARAPAYDPDATVVPLDIVFTDDLREFIHDQRVRMAFVIGLSGWFDDWPDGEVRMTGRVVLDLDIQ